MPDAAAGPAASTGDLQQPADSLGHQVVTFLWRTSLMLALLTASSAVRAVAVLIGLAGFVLVLRLQIKARRARRTLWTLAESLLTALYVLILVFAVVYDRMASMSPDQFSGISSRTDALYFTVTVVSTVGFGDIHAAGSAARLLVTAQMLINLVYVGTALRVLSNLRGGQGMSLPAHRDPEPPGQPSTGDDLVHPG